MSNIRLLVENKFVIGNVAARVVPEAAVSVANNKFAAL